jgi:hypothetical protein
VSDVHPALVSLQRRRNMTHIEFQGFMEGAAREGARAAGEIVQDVARGR